ncbi:hypothetical protein AB833_25545 [Chromatiales bacterium (ex Bugula neritina AB1)]|nr:hypothetical protein AB833_25545 [Chromatiales bacterium (ex Bugula neritina AB1)]
MRKHESTPQFDNPIVNFQSLANYLPIVYSSVKTTDDSTMRFIPAVILTALLGVVYWIGATIFTDRIERDIAQRSNQAVATLPDVNINVDGRDVTLIGNVNTQSERSEAKQLVDSVWGVRASQNELNVFKTFKLRASNNEIEGLKIEGTIDRRNSISELKQTLKPLSPEINLDFGARPMVNSAEKLQIGTGNLLLLNHGELTIDNAELVLSGLAADETVRSMIETNLIEKHAMLAPLDVIANIDVASSLTQACRTKLDTVLDQNTVLFEFDQHDILDEQKINIEQFSDLLHECPGSLLIEAHADHDGSEKYNLLLSKKRAQAVTDILLENGIDLSRIESFFYGETRPIASNESESERSYNRRVELQYVQPSAPNQLQQATIISSQSTE